MQYKCKTVNTVTIILTIETHPVVRDGASPYNDKTAIVLRGIKIWSLDSDGAPYQDGKTDCLTVSHNVTLESNTHQIKP
jgi:hypothetical protein